MITQLTAAASAAAAVGHEMAVGKRHGIYRLPKTTSMALGRYPLYIHQVTADVY